ncbi:MAG: FxLYD domain-containing protein [Verrucomicrobiota bacterium]
MPGSLQVLQSRLNWVETKDGLRIFLTGTVTNQSSEAWHDVEFDCRFLDANGVMVDAANARSRFTALPHDDAAFRVVIAPARATNDYASFKVGVGSARVAKGWF